MTVHKKHPVDAKAMAGKEEKPVEIKSEIKPELMVVSDVVTETTERIEVIKEVTPEEAKSKTSAESSSTVDPFSSFKEKMVEEEVLVSDGTSRKNYMWPILLIFIITILLLIGVFLYKSEINTKGKINVSTLTPTPIVATPEPTKIIDLTKYEIEIQNGGGISGEASRQKTSLEGEGFTVSSIGNADSSDYTDTIIKAKAEVDKDFIVKLKTVLSNSFTVGETKSLSEDSSVPVVVIIGTKK